MTELSIVFVYDPERCQQEEDDPQEAVMYFHPSWVNDQQRLALCGQLMGATQFFLTSFSCPRILSLDSGKFVLQQSGHYIVVGVLPQGLEVFEITKGTAVKPEGGPEREA
uniref:CCZ1/INTU/HSP4 first Longin domain-containing protein n=1 Tax=Timema cristinae TaxID=61476 RepID=A0A7R9H1C0_TIMCR|nr:unnamed protein product [Timema cristinae]